MYIYIYTSHLWKRKQTTLNLSWEGMSFSSRTANIMTFQYFQGNSATLLCVSNRIGFLAKLSYTLINSLSTRNLFQSSWWNWSCSQGFLTWKRFMSHQIRSRSTLLMSGTQNQTIKHTQDLLIGYMCLNNTHSLQQAWYKRYLHHEFRSL